MNNEVAKGCSKCVNNFYLSNAWTCTAIPNVANCACQENTGVGCSRCNVGYYRVDAVSCALLSTINCAEGC